MQRLNMEPENLPQMTIYQELEVLLTGAMRFVESLMMPGWRLYQVLIILALIVISYGMHHLVWALATSVGAFARWLEDMATADDCPNTPAPWAGVVFGAGLDHLGRLCKAPHGRHVPISLGWRPRLRPHGC